MIELAALVELAAALGTRTLVGNDSEDARPKPRHLAHSPIAQNGKSRRVSRERDTRRRFGTIASDLDGHELQSESFKLSESDLMEELEGPPKANLMLGFYSVRGVRLALKRYGFLDSLRSRGFVDLRIQIDPSDLDRQRVAVFGSRAQESELLLAELLVTRRTIELPTIMEPKNQALNMLSVEWLLLQDPTKSFSEERPRFPGQAHPGLGLFREVIEALHQACRRLGLDGLVMHPSWFHVAALGSPECVFLDPAIQGRFWALQDDLGTIDISEVSDLLDHNLVVRHDGSTFLWEAEEFVAPVSKRLRDYFSSANYAAERDRAREQALDAGIVRATNEAQCHEVRKSPSPPPQSVPVDCALGNRARRAHVPIRASLAPRSFAAEWQVDKLE